MTRTLSLSLHSDLHLELQDWPAGFMDGIKPDVIALVGDIDQLSECDLHLRRLATEFPSSHIIYTPGNHEGYFESDMAAAEASLMAEFADHPHIHILQQSSVVIGGVRFLGCTLWSSFDANGLEQQEAARTRAGLSINDFRLIGYKGRRFTPQDCQALGEQHQAWLAQALAEPFDGKTVVLTHFAPSMQVTNRRFSRDALTAYFNSDLDALIESTGPDLWCYGHIHDNIERQIGRTLLISNQHGYGRECQDSYQPNHQILL